MPDFEGTKIIILQPSDSSVPYSFHFDPCSASTANDGSIPYGLTVSQSSVSAHRIDGVSVTTGMIMATSLTSNVTTVLLSYLSSSGAQVGRYHLTFKLTLSDGSVHERDFNRVQMRNI